MLLCLNFDFTPSLRIEQHLAIIANTLHFFWFQGVRVMVCVLQIPMMRCLHIREIKICRCEYEKANYSCVWVCGVWCVVCSCAYQPTNQFFSIDSNLTSTARFIMRYYFRSLSLVLAISQSHTCINISVISPFLSLIRIFFFFFVFQSVFYGFSLFHFFIFVHIVFLV